MRTCCRILVTKSREKMSAFRSSHPFHPIIIASWCAVFARFVGPSCWKLRCLHAIEYGDQSVNVGGVDEEARWQKAQSSYLRRQNSVIPPWHARSFVKRPAFAYNKQFGRKTEKLLHLLWHLLFLPPTRPPPSLRQKNLRFSFSGSSIFISETEFNLMCIIFIPRDGKYYPRYLYTSRHLANV